MSHLFRGPFRLVTVMFAGTGLALLLFGAVASVRLSPEAQAAADFSSRSSVEASALPKKRIQIDVGANEEWIDTARLSDPQRQYLDLGPIGDAARVSFRITSYSDAALRVYSGTQLVRTFAHGGGTSDYLVDLRGAGNGSIRVVVDGPGPVWFTPAQFSRGHSENPNVLIVLIDTLRQDHLSCYGYARETSPHLDALARDGVLCSNLVPPSSWTRPSVGTLLTGTHPQVHGMQDRGDKMRTNAPQLAETLSRAGYHTIGFMTNPNCLPTWGFGEGFARYVDANSKDWQQADDARVFDLAIRELEMAGDSPWFMYVHAMGPHGPYMPPAPYDTKFNWRDYDEARYGKVYRKQVAKYDGEIAYTDAQFGRLIAALKANGQYDNTLIVVVSDHGEEFLDHGGHDHGHTLYEELLRVPFIVKLPGGGAAGVKRDGLVQMVDVAPTILDVIGLAPETQFQGESFASLLETGNWLANRIGHAALYLNAASMLAAKDTTQKYIRDTAKGLEQRFDLRVDPREQHPLAALPASDNRLHRAAMQFAAQGEEGLHILITSDASEERRVEGVIRGTGLGKIELAYREDLSRTSLDDEGMRFSITLPKDELGLGLSSAWQEGMSQDPAFIEQIKGRTGNWSEQENARLRVAMPLDAEVQIDLRVNGESAPVNAIHLGKGQVSSGLENASFRLRDLVAEANAYDPAALPRGFAIYVWYVLDAEKVEDTALDPSMREALEALGYMG